MIKETGLEKGNLTLDALHCNPATTEQINQANGSYLIQLKENQAQWLRTVKIYIQRVQLLLAIKIFSSNIGGLLHI